MKEHYLKFQFIYIYIYIVIFDTGYLSKYGPLDLYKNLINDMFSFLSSVAHLAKIDSSSHVLPPRKISRFLDNINYAFSII